MPIVQMPGRRSYIRDFMALVYPRNCLACTNSLFRHEEFICNHCYTNLPKSNFHLQPENELERIFHGRIQLQRAGSYYLFEKSGKVQQLLHHIKYKGNKALANELGKWYGASLKETEFAKADVIVPVPLYPKKLKQRGFNQSEEFAKGLSEVLNIPLFSSHLIRTDFTSTQTRKKKFERWENVKDKFELLDPERLSGKKIILVDDVITTGATIDACYQALSTAPGITVEVLSLAYALKGA
jgi:ComF family protein